MSFPLAFALNTLTKEEVVNKIRDYIKNNMYLNDEHDGEYSFDTYVDYDDEISTERLKKNLPKRRAYGRVRRANN